MKPTVCTAVSQLALLAPTLGRAQAAGSADPFGDLSGVFVSLLIVVCIILGAAWVLKRTPFAAATRKVGPLKLVATLPLGPKERLMLVEADGCEVLIGVSPAGIFPLHRTAHGSSGTVVESPPESLARPLSPSMWVRDSL
jgi:flagellar protein FliO/FliZ